ncbi:MAG: zinc finger CDGSH-type domain-containing protein [Bacteroidetes bacterium]|nr:MAG: zinc finger CDGSH-type domain-containing protein [Bacteroidota bacterium]
MASKITITKNGPIHVQGDFEICDPNGNTFDLGGKDAWLCRCGQSEKKPFCDGKHKACGFVSEVSAEKR